MYWVDNVNCCCQQVAVRYRVAALASPRRRPESICSPSLPQWPPSVLAHSLDPTRFKPTANQRRVLRRMERYLEGTWVPGARDQEPQHDAPSDSGSGSAASSMADVRRLSSVDVTAARTALLELCTAALAGADDDTATVDAAVWESWRAALATPAVTTAPPRAGVVSGLPGHVHEAPTATSNLLFVLAASAARADPQGKAAKWTPERVARALLPRLGTPVDVPTDAATNAADKARPALVAAVQTPTWRLEAVRTGQVNMFDLAAPARPKPTGAAPAAPPAPAAAPRSTSRAAVGPKHTLRVAVKRATYTEEAYRLFDKYQRAIHDDDTSPRGYERFLVSHPFTVRDRRRCA